MSETRDQFARTARRICSKSDPLTGPGSGHTVTRTEGTRLHRVRQVVDGKSRTKHEAAATFAHEPWAGRAVYRTLSAGWYCWEVPL